MFGFKVLAFYLLCACLARTSIAADEWIRRFDGLVFVETFDENPFETGKWVKSQDAKYVTQPVLIKPPTKTTPGFEDDKGIQLTRELRHYGFGAKLDQPFVSAGEDLIVQYEVKLEEGLSCGGAYVKLLRGEPNLEELNSDTPYSIMFGPDKCGNNNKVHFIVQYQNPVTQEWEEKHYNETLPAKLDSNTHLYTLKINKDSSFEIFVDMKSVNTGNLLTHMVPAIVPPVEIEDPADLKPQDWVDDAVIPDAEAVKPQDWDESQPMRITDPEAVMPATWQEDAEEIIADPEAARPEDWDDEEDGEWEAPTVPNPACAQGCGKWEPPTIKNPLYQGIWSAPMIPNPAFVGVWAARKIPNPAHFEVSNPVLSLAPVTALAVEVWTITPAILFDNFVLSHSTDAVDLFSRATFAKKADAERLKAKQEEEVATERQRERLLANGEWADVVAVRWAQFTDYCKKEPRMMLALGLVLVLSFLYFVFPGPPKDKGEAQSQGAQGIETDIDTDATDSKDAKDAKDAKEPKESKKSK
ncbi:Calreticulin family-domain-containing protein [Ochromonadaceae sp. CCMP2298]|nr:Calreticulin family-domain-containing protein [Ochromonadaceae sp. CCMP2298]